MSAAREVRARPVVVVACAHGDAAALTPVVRGLVARKLRVDLVPLTDANVQPLEAAVEQFGVGATYVVCHSAAIDRYTAELCELTVRAAEVPETRLVSAWFDAADPEAFVSMVWGRASEGSSGDIAPQAKRHATMLPAPPNSVVVPPRPTPRVVVHEAGPAANERIETDWDEPSSTRVAMKMALGWRRILHPATYAVFAVLVIGAGLYFGGYQAIVGAL
ncbi:MAG: hypothetical protein AAF721_34175 [Myxococcota bacterium]